MRYLYGDASPFPLNENFIDTLVAATEACVALMRLDGEADATRRQAQAARVEANLQCAELDGLAKAVNSALARHLTAGKPENATQAVAQKLAATMRAQIKQTRSAVIRQRDAAMRKTGIDQRAGAILDVLSEFLRERQLPETTWRLRWKTDATEAEPRAHLHASTPIGLQAVFEVAIPSDHRWHDPVKVSALARDVEVVLPIDKGWLRNGSRMSLQKLDKWYITEVEVSPERRSFVLARNLKDPTSRIEIVVDSQEQSEPTMRRLGGEGDHTRAHGFREEDIAPINVLWNHIEDSIEDLMEHRESVILATLDNRPVRELEQPRKLAEAVLESVGPLVREMRRRSRVPGEITLKRELGDGRREELFIPKQRLIEMIDALEPGQRAVFDIYGLEGTAEIVTIERPRNFPLNPRADSVAPVEAEDVDDLDENEKTATPKPVKPESTLRLVTAS